MLPVCSVPGPSCIASGYILYNRQTPHVPEVLVTYPPHWKVKWIDSQTYNKSSLIYERRPHRVSISHPTRNYSYF